MELRIRLARKEDIPALEALIAASVRELSVGYYTSEQMEKALVEIFGVDTQLIEDETYFVVEADEILAGCGGWSKRKTLCGGDQTKEESDPLIDPATDRARIRAFFIHPSFARKGIGSRLLKACEDAAMAAGFTQAEMVATLPGVPLYSVYGYEVFEEYELPMSGGEVLPVKGMAKSLK